MTLVLREYQEKCVDAIYDYLRTKTDNPVAVIPTGGGKTPILARICRDTVKEWNGRVIILSHVVELLEQAYNHLKKTDDSLPVGIYSAGLKSKQTRYPITIAGIQSACRRPEYFPAPNLIIVDEAHRVPPDGEGQYRTFLAAMREKNPAVRMIGLTATPYRMSSGPICGPESLFNGICFEVSVRELIDASYLSPLITRGPSVDTDFSDVSIKHGEFDQNELETLMAGDTKVALALMDLLHHAKNRKKILIFCTGVLHGQKVAEFLRQDPAVGLVGEVYADTHLDERAQVVKAFRDGDMRVLVNVQVFTLGFDAPNVDCVALMRATMSKGLYYQMVGRGFRISQGKTDCLVLDFGGNVERHGFVDSLKPTDVKSLDGDGVAPCKKCPDCQLYVHAAVSVCPECGHVFPKKERQTHGTESYDGNVLAPTEPEDVAVFAVNYSEHSKVKEGALSKTLRVDYVISELGIEVSEWVCIEHKGWARQKAVDWWSRRATTPAPATIQEAITRSAELAVPSRLKVNFSGRFPTITHYGKFVKPAQTDIRTA